jgi:hypothetical protein
MTSSTRLAAHFAESTITMLTPGITHFAPWGWLLVGGGVIFVLDVCLQLEHVVEFCLTHLTLEHVVEDGILCVSTMGDSFVKSKTCLIACSISTFAACVLVGV